MTCALELSITPPPLSLPEYRLHKVSRRRKVELFAACRRHEYASGSTHFDVRWRDGVLHFTGKLDVLPALPPRVARVERSEDRLQHAACMRTCKHTGFHHIIAPPVPNQHNNEHDS